MTSVAPVPSIATALSALERRAATVSRRAGYGPTVVLVGGGLRGYAVFERLVAGIRAGGPRRLSVVLVDPGAGGPGGAGRPGQSRLLLTNTCAADLAVPDPDCSGRTGPSVADWAQAVRRGTAPTPPDAVVAREVLALRPDSYPSRRLLGAYLEWAHQRLLAALPRSVTVTTVADRVTGLVKLADGRQGVRLANGPALAADAVILAQELDQLPRGEHAELAAFAQARGLTYLPPRSAAEQDLSGLRPGEKVLVRGLGPAFADLVSLVTEGRGGRFERCDNVGRCDNFERGDSIEHCDDRLVYRPSGREPVLYVGSRRGLPYHAKPGAGASTVLAAPERPRFFDAQAVAGVVEAGGGTGAGRAGDGGARFAPDVWPLMAKEIGWAYYREYFAAHPDRVALPWAQFEDVFARHGWYDARRVELVERAVPRAADRWEFEAVDRPLDWFAGMDADRVHEAVAQHVRRDLEACGRGTTTAVRRALIACRAELLRMVEQGLVHGGDPALDWWRRFHAFTAEGPPPLRLRQLLALAEAGVVRFVGPGLRLAADPAGPGFRARSDVTGFEDSAAAAVEAFLPGTGPSRQAGELAAAALGAVRSRSGSRVVGMAALERDGGSGVSGGGVSGRAAA